MKTRIISGVIIGVVILGTVLLGSVNSITYSIVLSLIGAVCVFELFQNTGFVKSIPLMVLGALFAMVSPFITPKALDCEYSYVIYVFIAAVVIVSLIDHKRIYPTTMAYAIAIPILISGCCRSIVFLASKDITGLFYLALLLCYTVFADIGAYFIGVYFGKHKMAPNISPKKTYEGLVGGMLSSIITVMITCLIFKFTYAPLLNVWATVLTTPIFVMLGVVGDLAASYIKRFAAIKDFGDTIPGHGGIVDRIDSMLIVAPMLYVFNEIINLSGVYGN